MKNNNPERFNLILSIIAAILMLQTLFYKFTANEESVYIFSTLGMEPEGRIMTGVAELFASVLLLFNRTRLLGALMGAGLMAGAIFAHVMFLGIEVKNDRGLLFTLACITLLCTMAIIYNKRLDIPDLLKLKL